MFDHKKIFILGMARSGYEVAKLLSKHSCDILINDLKEQDSSKVKELEELGVTVKIGVDPLELFDSSFDYVIKNPGIRLDHPVCLKAEEYGIPVRNELEVAYQYLPQGVKIIGITGSNGKTTTTTLIHKFLIEQGLPAHLGGNIGTPVSALVEQTKPNDLWVLEISGHQLHDMRTFKTDVSVMTNLSPVHLDHFGSYENYKKNKACIFRNHTKEDLAIINLENEDVLEETKEIPSSKIYFSSKRDTDLCIKENAIYYKDEKIVDCSDIKIKGMHNYENIMCAIAATKPFGVTKETVCKVLKEFGGVEHRIEYVGQLNGVEFYNDSKSTNVKSTQIALNTFKNPTIVLLGGLDRHLPFDDLEPYMKHVKAVVCYGETKLQIQEFCTKIHVDCYVVDVLKEAVEKAYSLSSPNDVILLSPACASWDQYKCFEDRGDEFKACFHSLKRD